MATAETKSTPQLIRETFGHVTDILQKEIQLARAEMREGVGKMKGGAAILIVGAGLAIAGLTVLLGGLAAGLATVMTGWLAGVIVGAVALVLSIIVIKAGASRIDPAELEPERAEKSIGADIELAKEHLS